jgi:crotonobetainyl-CoA:carnitine CoA-transferase CaiB-like acyl-CoA transferase
MRQDSDDDLPLHGIRVVEMATLGMGPIAGQTLGDYGADVIKLESVAGDLFRHITPAVSADMGHTFIQLNRNKRSLALDVKSARGRELVQDLLGSADVFLSNTRPSALRKLGLDHASLRAANPGLIHCTAHGFSENGPYAGRPAADDTIQAMSGLVDLQHRAGGQPVFVASVVADKAVGLMIVNAILTALLRRAKTGTGQSIEVPMFESMVAFLMPEHMAGKTYTPQRGAPGYARIVNPKRRPFRTADGLICVLPYTDDQWRRFFELIDRPDLLADAELATQIGRSRRFEELYAIIEDVMPRRTTAAWTQLLTGIDILFGEVNTLEQLFDDPHLTALGMFPEYDHPSEGRLRLIGFPIHSSEPSTALRRLPPRLGEHSVEIAVELGVPEQQVSEMIAAGELRVAAR